MKKTVLTVFLRNSVC